MHTIEVALKDKSYNIEIKRGLLDEIGSKQIGRAHV